MGVNFAGGSRANPWRRATGVWRFSWIKVGGVEPLDVGTAALRRCPLHIQVSSAHITCSSSARALVFAFEVAAPPGRARNLPGGPAPWRSGFSLRPTES